MVTNNARILLEGVVEDEFKKRAPKRMKSVHKFFEFYVASELLKDRELSDDEILSGISDNEQQRDGGIDGLFLFGNRRFLLNLDDFDDKQDVSDIEILITQCKYTDKVSEDIIHKLDFSMRDFLDLRNSLESVEMRERYDSDYLDTMQTFRDLYRYSRGGVRIRFNFFIAHLANDVASQVIGKSNQLQQTVREFIPEAEVSVEFLSPKKLITIIRREKKQEFNLIYKRDVISPDERGFTLTLPRFNGQEKCQRRPAICSN